MPTTAPMRAPEKTEGQQKFERYDHLCRELARREAAPQIDPSLSEDDLLQEARIAVLNNYLSPSAHVPELDTSARAAALRLLSRDQADEVLARQWISWRLQDYTRKVMRQRRGQTGFEDGDER